jgi:hypothetical protein|tara:strand:+ start:167 stop:844 length:678 start_codon:yes stop_codon:yes gene_type:complete
MKVSILQPSFLPWLGYFRIIQKSDIVVFLDDVQFDKRSWQQKNMIKTANGPLSLTIPVLSKNKFDQKINQVLIDYKSNFIKKHLTTIEQNYKKTQYFNLYFNLIEKIYNQKPKHLLDLNVKFILFFIETIFKVKKKYYFSSDLNLKTKKSQLILDICIKLNSDHYICANGSKNYLDEDSFKNEKIKIEYNDYNHPQYKQLHGDFIYNLSTLDLAMNEGPNSWSII